MQPRSKSAGLFLGNENLPITDTLLASWLLVILLILCLYIKEKIKNCAWPYTGSSRNYIAVESQIESMLPGRGKFLPFIGTIFIFVGVSNISIIRAG